MAAIFFLFLTVKGPIIRPHHHGQSYRTPKYAAPGPMSSLFAPLFTFSPSKWGLVLTTLAGSGVSLILCFSQHLKRSNSIFWVLCSIIDLLVAANTTMRCKWACSYQEIVLRFLGKFHFSYLELRLCLYILVFSSPKISVYSHLPFQVRYIFPITKLYLYAAPFLLPNPSNRPKESHGPYIHSLPLKR